MIFQNFSYWMPDQARHDEKNAVAFVRFPKNSIGKLGCSVNSPLTKQDSFNIILRLDKNDVRVGHGMRKHDGV